ncbi:MAG: VCBS repeat-containing protein [Betaproteobacteria bacterium]|nr:VCBS repeat-containing protein [Betaproteobacteria bacterium]MCL2886554.1 VCBS repeat-containing protein [Betaproteobacteria bacterium]
MKIASTDVQMSASHASLQRHEITQSMEIWTNGGRSQRNDLFLADGARERLDGNLALARAQQTELVSLSAAGRAAQAAADTAEAVNAAAEELAVKDPKLILIRQMLEMWLGHSVRVFAGLARSPQVHVPGGAPAPPAPAAQSGRAGFGLVYERREIYAEFEQTNFSASGTVKTADGREINFQLELSMSRSYYEESNISLRLGAANKAVDPLVLNFSGAAAELTNQRFAFDLNADGTMEWINFVAPGSGFLVFDRNGDGVINDGSELFGPSTNDGFAELAALDDDGNGWIDENDAAFSQLQIWSRDADGNDRLQSLAEAGVGAIFLGRVATPFDIKTTGNEMLGQVRDTGIFLQENGIVGTIQKIDLTT